MFTVTLTHNNLVESYNVEKGQSLFDAAQAAGIDYPHYCLMGNCGSCKCLLQSGSVRQLGSFTNALTHEQISSRMILGCQSTPTSDLSIQIQHES